MFIINPDPFLLPTYRISPFKTEHIAINNELPKDDFASDYFNKKFGEGNWHYTCNGREAIELALQQYQLRKDDLVTILTTSENFYISSCVTKSIEKYCHWNREIVPETRIILVNHEFGYPYAEMERIKEMGLPIIEDCCTTFFSQDKEEKIGKYGDFAVYSFPKFFPIQIGGILAANKIKISNMHAGLANNEIQYIENVVSHNLRNESGLLERRNHNFDYAVKKMSGLGFSERFLKDKKIVPSALLLNNNGIIKNLDHLKKFLFDNGIQSSIFYGEDAFFIPTHQNLDTVEIDFHYELLSSYLKYNNR
jgi:hypothetical protein